MKLSDWIKSENLTVAEVVERIGDCSVSGVRKWARGERMPGREEMQRIFLATNGRVTANDFYDLNMVLEAGRLPAQRITAGAG